MRTCIALRGWRNDVPLEFEMPRSTRSGERIFTRGGGKRTMEFREIGRRAMPDTPWDRHLSMGDRKRRLFHRRDRH